MHGIFINISLHIKTMIERVSKLKIYEECEKEIKYKGNLCPDCSTI